MLTHINNHIHANNLLPDFQYGFRHAHSTLHPIEILTSHTQQQLRNKTHTGLVLLDMEKAFDTIWIDGLIHKMIVNHFPTHIIHLIRSYLSDRSFTVAIGDDSSTPRRIPAGVPQGSLLGPILFTFYIHDMPSRSQTKLLLFADDTAIFTSSRSVNTIVRNLQGHLYQIRAFCKDWKIKINNTKSQSILFTRKNKNYIPQKSLTIDAEHKLPWVTETKYLGITFDRKLNFTKHLNIKYGQALGMINLLHPLLGRKSVLDAPSKRRLYLSLVRPIFTYASQVWCDRTGKTNIYKLQKLQNKACRLILGQSHNPHNNHFLSNDYIHNNTNIPYLTDYIHKLKLKFTLNNTDHVNETIRSRTST